MAHAVEHARAYPNAPAPATCVSNARMARDYMRKLGGAAYLPRRMIAQDLAAETLHLVEAAHLFRRPVFAVYPARTAQLELIQRRISMLESGWIGWLRLMLHSLRL